MKDNLTSRAQTLRKQMTKEERWLWYGFLRNHPIQFRRQVVFAPYIVDFYAHRARLAIELDGSGHYEPAQMQYDEKRTDILRERYGVYVLRFTNLEIQRQFRAVCEQIDNCIAQRLPLGGSWHGEAVTDEGRGAVWISGTANLCVNTPGPSSVCCASLRSHLPRRGRHEWLHILAVLLPCLQFVDQTLPCKSLPQWKRLPLGEAGTAKP